MAQQRCFARDGEELPVVRVHGPGALASHRLRVSSQNKKLQKIFLVPSSFLLLLSFSNYFLPLLAKAKPQVVFNMESTRVFVSGLPPTFSNDQLRKHFATRFQVTDAHVLPKRRIGFVGFKSAEVAREAVSYFNRTYVKMSKISVDIARPVCDLMLSLLIIPAFPPIAFADH